MGRRFLLQVPGRCPRRRPAVWAGSARSKLDSPCDDRGEAELRPSQRDVPAMRTVKRLWFTLSFFVVCEGYLWGYGNEFRRVRRILLAGVKGMNCRGDPVEDLLVLFLGERFSSRVHRGVDWLLAQPAIRVRAHWSQPIMTFPYRQAGKRARPIYQTDNSPCGRPPRDVHGSRAVFQNRFHPAQRLASFLD